MTKLPAPRPDPVVPLTQPDRGGLTEEDVARLTGPGLAAFFAIARKWDLSVEEQMALLDLEARSTFFQWKKIPPARLGRDRLERLSHLLGIYKALRILFPLETAADAWVKKPNKAILFGGRPALALMMEGGITGLAAVRSYLDAQRGGWA